MQAVRRGHLPGVKHGRRILVRRADLDAYLATHAVRWRNETADGGNAAGTADSATLGAAEVASSLLDSLGLRPRGK